MKTRNDTDLRAVVSVIRHRFLTGSFREMPDVGATAQQAQSWWMKWSEKGTLEKLREILAPEPVQKPR